MTQYYNAHHSPIGAFATLTLGNKGASGGLGLELSGPANENVYVGIEDAWQPGKYWALPFFSAEGSKGADDYDVEHLSGFLPDRAISFFGDGDVDREMGPSIDEWRAGDLKFRLISPIRGVPDPNSAGAAEMRDAVLPAVFAELTIDNRSGKLSRRAFLGYQGSNLAAGMRTLAESGLVGIAQHTFTGIASADVDVQAGIGLQAERILEPDSDENLSFLVGNIGLLVATVGPGELRTFRFVVGFFRDGLATTGIKTRYLYRRYFADLEAVLRHGIERFEDVTHGAPALDQRVCGLLSPERAWMVSQAIRSYYGSTQLLETEDGQPIWVVNEGEYRMMNTLDLTVDQAFFELALNPWTVRNVLNLYLRRYAYEDGVRSATSDEVLPGGISFTHDMGVANQFSRPGYSGYEQSHQSGCFSYMTAEELMNWVLTAGLYGVHTRDNEWVDSNRKTFLDCLRSLLHRDHPDPEMRNGMVSFDAARCAGGAEITTYDSLDASLGSAKNNLYLGIKGWAAYRLLENLFCEVGEDGAAQVARLQAGRALDTVLGAEDDEGKLPASLGGGVSAFIIPAIEALVYPHVLGIPIDGRLKDSLSRHFRAIMQPGMCKFPDGGWKLSSTSRNSWLSKIYLCQFVAEDVLGISPDIDADRAHMAWLLDEDNSYFAWSDQMLSGKAVGSRYYPRGVTGILWAASGEFDPPLQAIARLLASGTTEVQEYCP